MQETADPYSALGGRTLQLFWAFEMRLVSPHLLLLLIGSAIFGGCRAPVEPFLVLSGPKDLTRFEVRDGEDEVIWAMSAEESQNLSAIYYGVVPEGFVQIVPEGGTEPRELEDGEVLVTTTVTERREFEHIGFASGTHAFRASHSEMRNLE